MRVLILRSRTAETKVTTEISPLIDVIHFADPWCWWSWGLEPVIQRLRAVYGDQLNLVYKMGGITDSIPAWRKEYDVEKDEALVAWISESSSITGMPADPRCYLKTNATTTWPACIAIKAAQLQGEGAESFVKSWNDLLAVIASKSAALETAMAV